MPLWFEILVSTALVLLVIFAFCFMVTYHETKPDTSSITSTLNRQSSDLAMLLLQHNHMEERAGARFEVQRHEGEMIRRMFSDGVHLNPGPAKKPLSDVDVKKILSEARLTFVEAPKNASK